MIPGLDVGRVVVIDETWAKTNMARTHGYAPRGERLVGAAPHGHWHTTTFVGALRADGFIAPLVVEGAGCQLRYLPPYSPDLSPIENAFSKLKRLLRSAAERTVDGLWSAIGRSPDQFRPDECRNYFRHCGYAATKT